MIDLTKCTLIGNNPDNTIQIYMSPSNKMVVVNRGSDGRLVDIKIEGRC